MSLNSSIFTALSIGALLVACGDGGSGGSGGASGGGTSDGGGSTNGGSTGDGGSVGNGGAPVGGAAGAVCADLDPACTMLDQDLCICEGCSDVCAESDCVCPSCVDDAACAAPGSCTDDNECDPFNEGCECADCVDHPQCP